jgi:hypothetical protein
VSESIVKKTYQRTLVICLPSHCQLLPLFLNSGLAAIVNTTGLEEASATLDCVAVCGVGQLAAVPGRDEAEQEGRGGGAQEPRPLRHLAHHPFHAAI